MLAMSEGATGKTCSRSASLNAVSAPHRPIRRASFSLDSGRALLQQGKLSEAITQLEAAVAADPTFADAHLALADAYTRQGRTADAALQRQQAGKSLPEK